MYIYVYSRTPYLDIIYNICGHLASALGKIKKRKKDAVAKYIGICVHAFVSASSIKYIQ